MARKLGYQLKTARKLAGLSLRDLETKGDKSHAHYGHIEQDRYLPGSSELLLYSELTGFSVDSLMAGADVWEYVWALWTERCAMIRTELALEKQLALRAAIREKTLAMKLPTMLLGVRKVTRFELGLEPLPQAVIDHYEGEAAE